MSLKSLFANREAYVYKSYDKCLPIYEILIAYLLAV